MSLIGINPPATSASSIIRARDIPPVSMRFTPDQYAALSKEAAGTPLGLYAKAKVLGNPAIRLRRSGLSVQDSKALAAVLAALGQTRLASNINQLAHLAHTGSLPVTPETEAELVMALRYIRDIRRLLLKALGQKPEDLA